MNDPVNKLIRQLTADKKKLGVMLGLLAVGLLLWGRLLLKEVPRTATATPKATATAAASSSPAPASDPTPQFDEPAVTVVVDLASTLTRDVFALDTAGYPEAKNGEESSVPAKPEIDTPDKAYRVARATEVSRGLTLEGVILSDEPSVIINGQLLQEGQQIEGLTVYRIENRKVVLEMDGVYIRLGM
jgi:hypothetical protein